MAAGVRATGKRSSVSRKPRSRSHSHGAGGSVLEPTTAVARQACLEEALMQQMEMQKQLHEQLEVRYVLHNEVWGGC